MKIVAFNFTKVEAERLKDKADSIKFNTKIDLPSIEPIKSDILKTKEELVKVNFVYHLSYEPSFAKIELSGDLIVALDSKVAKEVLKGFKDKGSSEDFRLFILNFILKKTNLRALRLEEELNLPLHLPLITLNKDSLKEKKE